MQCFVYRSNRKEGLYIYLAEADAFDQLPQALRKEAGELELALEFELTEQRKLGRENPHTVLSNLAEQGFHVQLPPMQNSLIETLNVPD